MAKISIIEAKKKLEKYCAYQERCHSEVRHKLLQYEVYGEALEEVLTYLIENNFLNELRFATAFARGKMNLKSWGKTKIQYHLKAKGISDYCINKALAQFDEKIIETKIALLYHKKNNVIKEINPTLRKHKIAQYIIRKGFEPNQVWKIINEN